MSFRHLDRYSTVRSPLTAMPPTARLIGAVVLAIGAASLPEAAWWQLGVLAVVVIGLVVAARVPPRVLALRLAGPLCFVVIASVGVLVLAPGTPVVRLGWLTLRDEGLRRFGSTLGRGAVALSGAVILVTTTSFPDFLRALRQLRLPRAVTTALGLAYRLLYVLLEEIERLQRAARSRNAGAGRASRRRLLIGIVAAVLQRTFHRSERTHLAMLARGFDGDLPVLVSDAWEIRTIVALATFVGAIAAVTVSAYLVP